MRKQILEIQKRMKEENIDAYMVMTDDFHGSEYVGDYFKCREYLSGFTGSAGRMIITADEAGLWTDGRYFIQAAAELSGSGIKLYKMGEQGVPDIMQYLSSNMLEGQTLAFDGRTVSAAATSNIEKRLSGKNIKIVYDVDLVGDIWDDRPERNCTGIWQLGIKYAGKSREEKIEELRNILKNNKSDGIIITALDEIAWLLNIRANDIDYNPVALSYLILETSEDENSYLFVNKNAVSDEIENELNKCRIFVREYDEIYDYVKVLEPGKCYMTDMSKANTMVVRNITSEVKIKNFISPVMQMKAVKNKAEMDNERISHIKDGVAVTKLIYWLKKNVNNMNITEMDVVNKLDDIRRDIDSYIEPSFATISAYGTNGAIVHYEPDEDSDKLITKDGFLLLDAGGHYLEGTTDMTRTISVGNISSEMKNHYTAVLKGNLRLADAKFMYGCRGANLDYIAREPLWKMGLDFKHGTGHGVGYLLNVHESPNSFRWKINPMQINSQDAVLEEGMITSDEPGVYIEGKYGIRLENLLMCVKDEKNYYGQFMRFDVLTMVPFDRESIDVSALNQDDRYLLNAYHSKVYETISSYMEEDEREWLKNETKEI